MSMVISTEGMSKKTRQTDLSAQLRAAFEDGGLSRFELARRAGISYAVVHRFFGGDRDIRLETASRLCKVLGLELRPLGSSIRRKGR